MIDGETFQHYQVLHRADGSVWELGRGAMGVTLKATDTSLHCTVALKVIRAESLDNEQTRQRFVREARAAARLSHPNVARVFHLGESARSYFYAMEFIDGETLEACVRRRGPLDPTMALRIALQVANALRAASREKLVHRDIKPSNIMLLREDEDHEEDIHVKVIDFGLAKAMRGGTGGDDGASAAITVAGFVGTPHYASPEQLDEKELDARSDFYSLGVTLWYMLAGKPPFSGSVVQVMSQHLSRTPPFETLGDLPPGIVPLLRRLLEKEPGSRPQNASELRRQIEEALAVCEGMATPTVRLPAGRGADDKREAAMGALPIQSVRGASGLRRLATLGLLLLGFVVIAGFVALAAWYVLGPDDDLPSRRPPTEKRQKIVPSVSPGVPQGFWLGRPQ